MKKEVVDYSPLQVSIQQRMQALNEALSAKRFEDAFVLSMDLIVDARLLSGAIASWVTDK